MHILSTVAPACNAASPAAHPPDATPPPSPPRRVSYQTAAPVAAEHQAYTDAEVIRQHAEELKKLCDEFATDHKRRAIRDHLAAHGLANAELSDDFAALHRAVAAAGWNVEALLAVLRTTSFDTHPTPHTTEGTPS